MNSESLQEKKSRAIRRIVEAAAEVFGEVGFAGARMERIADRAGVNKAMIYYRVGDKEELYGQVLHEAFADMASRMTRNAERRGTPEEKLRAYIRNIVRTVDRRPHLPRIMMREVASGAKNFPEMAVGDLAAIVGSLAKILADGEKAGVFAKTNPFIVHMMILGTASFYRNMQFLRERLPHFPKSLKELDKTAQGGMAEEIERLVLKAVLSRAAKGGCQERR